MPLYHTDQLVCCQANPADVPVPSRSNWRRQQAAAACRPVRIDRIRRRVARAAAHGASPRCAALFTFVLFNDKAGAALPVKIPIVKNIQQHESLGRDRVEKARPMRGITNSAGLPIDLSTGTVNERFSRRQSILRRGSTPGVFANDSCCKPPQIASNRFGHATRQLLQR
jgi:hypothetical protein